MAEDAADLSVEAVAGTRTPSLERQLEELTRKRLTGARVSPDLLALRIGLGERVYKVVERVFLSPTGELGTLLENASIPPEDVQRLLRWQVLYWCLAPSFEVARREASGRHNVWGNLTLSLGITIHGAQVVNWKISDAEDDLFESTDLVVSVLTLVVGIFDSIVSETRTIAGNLKADELEIYEKLLQKVAMVVPGALKSVQDVEAGQSG